MAERSDRKTPNTTTAKKKAPARQRAAKPKPTQPSKPQRAATPSRTTGGKAARRSPGQARQMPPLTADLIAYFGDQERVDLIVAECVPHDATAGDVLRLLLEARRLDADPLRRDVYLASERSRDGAGSTYAVAARRDALLGYANRHACFLGHDEAAIYDEDVFAHGRPDAGGGTLAERVGITHESKMPGKRGKLVGAWCAAEMRGRPPVVRVLAADQYVGTEEERDGLDPDDPKRRYPDACLIAAAMCNTLRIACGLNDVVGADELTRRPDPLPDLNDGTAPAIFSEGPVDDLDARILDAYQQAQALDGLLWPPAKLSARLASIRHAAATEGAEDPVDLDAGREALAHEIEQAVQAEVARRHDPVKLKRRLDELRAFDPVDLDAEARREYDTERAAVEAAARAAGLDTSAAA